MKKIFLLAIVFTSILLFSGCDARDTKSYISKEIKMDVSSGTEITSYDSHEGWLGDGTRYVALTFKDDTILKKMKENKSWKSFPLDEIVQQLVYGEENEASAVGPYITDNNGKILVPPIKNGYYLFIDRYEDKKKEPDVMSRHSFNCTVVLYDVDTNTLHYCELDT